METVDVITYSGQIGPEGYTAVCNLLKNKKSEKVIVVLATGGGDPNSAFRIARALQHSYGHFDALVPRFCKSAGTLLVIGAQRLYLGDMSELGPLDIQVKKNDEIIGRNSGLEILQAVNYLQSQAMNAFRAYLLELTKGARLSTKLASDISSKLTTGLFEPIFAQIDPMKLAEMQRATEIAFAYGNRLNEKSLNLKEDGLITLVTGYPSHGFVIDRKEARTIFVNVVRPEGALATLSDKLFGQMEGSIDSKSPKISMFTLTVDAEQKDGEQNDGAQNPGNSSGGPKKGGTKVGIDSKIEPASSTGNNGAKKISVRPGRRGARER